LRRRGETFVQSDPELAEADFLRALEIARSQDARLWELRAAVSLAIMWRAAGKRQDASNLLSPVYADFTEGLEIADLKRAKQLIDALA
jgi:predicted ATPase